MRRILPGVVALLAVVLSGFASVACGQETAPLENVVVIVHRGHKTLVDDLTYLGGTTAVNEAQKKPQTEDFLRIMNGALGQLLNFKDFDIRNLPGVDPERPWGMVVRTDGSNIIPLVFVPVTEEVAFLDEVKKQREGKVEEKDGVYEIGANQTMFLKIDNGWAWLAQLAEQISDLPDPTEVVGDLTTQHDAAARFHVQKLPAAYRDWLVDMLNSGGGMLPVAELPPGMTDAVKLFMTEAELVTLSSSIDAEKQQLAWDLVVKPVAGSGLAEFADKLDSKTRLGIFVDKDAKILARLSMPLDSGLQQHVEGHLAEYDKQVQAAIDAATDVQSDKEREIFKDIARQLTEIIRTGVQSGKLDMGMKLALVDKKKTLTLGAVVGDSSQARELIARVAELGAGDPGLKSAKKAAETHNDTDIHTFEFVKDDTPEMKALDSLVGSPLILCVAATADGRLFATLGPDSLAQMKAAIDSTEATAPPAEMIVDVRTILPPLQAAATADVLKAALGILPIYLTKGDPRLMMSIEPTSEGLRMHGEAHDALVRVSRIASGMLLPQIIKQFSEGGGALPALPKIGQ